MPVCGMTPPPHQRPGRLTCALNFSLSRGSALASAQTSHNKRELAEHAFHIHVLRTTCNKTACHLQRFTNLPGARGPQHLDVLGRAALRRGQLRHRRLFAIEPQTSGRLAGCRYVWNIRGKLAGHKNTLHSIIDPTPPLQARLRIGNQAGVSNNVVRNKT